MLRNPNEISSKQVFILIISVQISFGILSLASSLAEKVGHDGWISVLLSGLWVCLLIYIMLALLKRFKTLSILEISTYLLGKLMGTFINLLIIAYLIYTSALALRMFTDIVKISVLRFTPAIVLSAFFIIPIVYLNWYGLKYIARFASIKPAILIILVIYYLLLAKYFRFTFLQPIGAAGMKEIIKSSYTPYTSFIGFELVSVIYPFIKDKKNALKFSILGNLTTLAFYLITVVFLTGFFGEEMLKQLQFPVFSLSRAYRAPVLERLDLFFISLWFPIMGTLIKFYFFSAYQSLKKLLNIEKDIRKSKLLISILTITVIVLSNIPKDMLQVTKLFDILGYMGTAFIVYIIICFILSFVKRPGGQKNEKAI